MCGIAGIYYFGQGTVQPSELNRMTDCLVHRGPDGEGIWVNETGNIGFGHRRLAIIDLTVTGNQPMTDDNGATITYNGEIYNFLEIREKLITKGHRFRSNSDTEVILAAYAEYGEDCLEYFDGMFSFAIWNSNKKELFVARDRFGEKPFYYYKDTERFIFASEMKAIFAAGVRKEISDKMVFYYLAYDVVENPNDKSETFYENVRQLPAAHCLTIDSKGNSRIRKYWDIETKTKRRYAPDEAVSNFRELFHESVRIRLRSDVPVGSSFSGGLDSSSIVASIISKNGVRNLNTFTARFDDPNYDEGSYIRCMQKKYSFEANFCYPNPALLIDEIDNVFYHQEEPFGSTSIINQWEVMKLAKATGVTVLLDGQGADETIAGYYKYFRHFLMEQYLSKDEGYLNQVKAINEKLKMDFALTRTQMIYAKLPGVYNRLGNFARPYTLQKTATDISKSFYRSFKDERTPFRHFRSLNDSLHFDTFRYGLGKLLRFADRNSMAFSREVRLPFLSHKLVEFVFSLATEFKMNKGWSKYILRLSMEDILPPEIAWRTEKRGFQAPGWWMKEKRISDLLEESAQLLVNKKYIKNPEPQNAWKYLMIAKTLGN